MPFFNIAGGVFFCFYFLLLACLWTFLKSVHMHVTLNSLSLLNGQSYILLSCLLICFVMISSALSHTQLCMQICKFVVSIF